MTAPVVMWGSLRWRVLVWSCSEPGEWTYEAIHDPKGTGWSFIVARDEDGDLISSM